MVDLMNLGLTGDCDCCKQPFKWKINVHTAIGVKWVTNYNVCENCKDTKDILKEEEFFE